MTSRSRIKRSSSTIAADARDVIYRGRSSRSGRDRVLVARGGAVRPLKHFVPHSRSGMSYGRELSGMSETARCILADFLELRPLSDDSGLWDAGSLPEIDHIYEAFTFHFMVGLPHGVSWDIRGRDIRSWLQSYPPAPTCSTCRSPIELEARGLCVWCRPERLEEELA